MDVLYNILMHSIFLFSVAFLTEKPLGEVSIGTEFIDEETFIFIVTIT